MQPGPETLHKQREKKLLDEAAAKGSGANLEVAASLEGTGEQEFEIIGHYKGKIKGSEFKEVVELSSTLYGIHWEHQKKLLDLIELLCREDRQFAVARSQAMAVIHSEFANMDVLVRQILNALLKENRMLKSTLDTAFAGTVKEMETAKENGNG